MAGVSETGFTKLTSSEIVTKTNTAMYGAFGTAFDVSPEGPDGQTIGILSAYAAGHWTMGEAAYNAYNPAMAYGVGLDNLVRLNGIKRITERAGQVALQLDGTDGFVVVAGSRVSTVDGIEYTTAEAVVLPGEVMATATTVSTIEIGAGQVTVIVDEAVGWTSVTNNEPAVTGIVSETDTQLRARRERSVIRTGTSTAEAIYAAVADLNLQYIAVIENDADVAVDGVPAHSFHTIAEGSTAQLVAQRIYNNKPAGIQAFGAVEVDVTDSKGYPHTIGFSRPTSKTVEIICTLHRPEGESLDGPNNVQDALIAHINTLQIAEDVVWADLFAPATTVSGVKIQSITVAFEGETQGTTNLPISITEKAVASLVSVTIVEV